MEPLPLERSRTIRTAKFGSPELLDAITASMHWDDEDIDHARGEMVDQLLAQRNDIEQTAREDMMASHYRTRRRITQADVAHVKELRGQGLSYNRIVVSTGLSKAAIGDIVHGRHDNARITRKGKSPTIRNVKRCGVCGATALMPCQVCAERYRERREQRDAEDRALMLEYFGGGGLTQGENDE